MSLPFFFFTPINCCLAPIDQPTNQPTNQHNPSHPTPTRNTGSMGAYKFLEELWRKKQADLLRFLLRVRAWEYRQLPKLYRLQRPTRTDKAHRLGYKAKQVGAGGGGCWCWCW
jgi:hypothetical protein